MTFSYKALIRPYRMWLGTIVCKSNLDLKRIMCFLLQPLRNGLHKLKQTSLLVSQSKRMGL